MPLKDAGHMAKSTPLYTLQDLCQNLTVPSRNRTDSTNKLQSFLLWFKLKTRRKSTFGRSINR